MIYQCKTLDKSIIMISAVCFCLFGLTSACAGGQGHTQKQVKESHGQHASDNLPPGQRIVHGTVEGVNENTIKVNYGEAGEMSPRYLELDKLGSKADVVKQGDRLKITVNNKNKIVDYQLVKESH